MNAKVKKSLNTLARILIAGLACWFIYRQVFVQGDFGAFIDQIERGIASESFLFLALAALVLVPVNWSLEAIKWRMLILPIEPLTFGAALKSVLTGITLSLFTPNRTGDFLGRVFTLRRANPVKGALLTIAGSITQLIVTLVAGLLALVFYLPRYAGFTEIWQQYLYAGLVILSLTLSALLVLFCLRVPVIGLSLHRIIRPSWRKIRLYLRVIERIKRKTMLRVLLLSTLRYVVFSGQFYLLLRAFELPVAYLHALMLIAMTYFVMSAIPTVALADLGIRGSVSIYFIGRYFPASETAAAAILSASTLIWIINLALPALAGILFIRRLNFTGRREKYAG